MSCFSHGPLLANSHLWHTEEIESSSLNTIKLNSNKMIDPHAVQNCGLSSVKLIREDI